MLNQSPNHINVFINEETPKVVPFPSLNTHRGKVERGHKEKVAPAS
jgi:hypothetical protein